MVAGFFQQSSIICIGYYDVGGHDFALQHGENYNLLVTC